MTVLMVNMSSSRPPRRCRGPRLKAARYRFKYSFKAKFGFEEFGAEGRKTTI